MSSRADYTLFTEKYRPQKIDHCILPAEYRKFFKKIVKTGDIPNLLLYSSSPGTGKTTVAKALCLEAGVDYLYINASKDTGIDTLRTTITKYASGKSLSGKKKVVILDEVDGSSATSFQAALRAFIEEFHNSCRFILTCNYVNKIITPLRSRCQEFDFNVTTKELKEELVPKISDRLEKILKTEEVSFEDGVVGKLADQLFPDIRKMLSVLQQYSTISGHIDNQIFKYESVDEEFYDFILNKQFTKARQFVLDSGYNFDDLYVSLYRNLVPRMEKQLQPQAILAIAEWQYRSSFSADKEIPFAAMLLEIIGLGQ